MFDAERKKNFFFTSNAQTDTGVHTWKSIIIKNTRAMRAHTHMHVYITHFKKNDDDDDVTLPVALQLRRAALNLG